MDASWRRGRADPLPVIVASLLALAVGAGCGEEGDRLVIELVPNPEVNTRAQVSALVNRLEVILDIDEGFEALDAAEGDSWGPYEVTDFDGDGVLELKLVRPGDRALDPFALLEGHQEGRTLHITALGIDTGQVLVALGGSHSRFGDGNGSCEVPFNLLPDQRPLRVVTMNPPTGSRDLTPPVDGVTIQLGGEVLDEALSGRVHLLPLDLEDAVEITPSLVVSYIETSMGRLTNVRFRSCALTPGRYRIVVDTDVCTPSGQCLDQLLDVEGAQPFEGHLHVRGAPSEPPLCEALAGTLDCSDPECHDGFSCDDETCLPDYDAESGNMRGDSCDPALCARPLGVCHEGSCLPDCAAFGVCPDLTQRCDVASGLCL